MADPTHAARETPLPLDAPERPGRLSWLVRPAPAPDEPQARDRSGARHGMAIALIGGGVFWGAVGVAVWLLRR